MQIMKQNFKLTFIVRIGSTGYKESDKAGGRNTNMAKNKW